VARRDDRRPHRLRFQDHRRQSLAIAVGCSDAWHHRDAGAFQPVPYICRLHKTRELDVGANFPGETLERGPQRPIADENSAKLRSIGPQASESTNEIFAAFFFHEPAYEHRDWFTPSTGRTEAACVNAVAMRDDLVLRVTLFKKLVSNEIGYCDDQARPVHDALTSAQELAAAPAPSGLINRNRSVLPMKGDDQGDAQRFSDSKPGRSRLSEVCVHERRPKLT
jgi:hypothetical protein